MKVVKILNAVFIATIFSIIAIPILILLFPITTIVELITFVQELFVEDRRWKHNMYANTVSDVVNFIEEVMHRMMK